MEVLREHRRRGLVPPAGQPGEAIGAVAYEREPVGDAFWLDAPLRPHRGLVVRDVASPIPKDDAVADDELGHVLVGRADHDPFDARIGGEALRRGADGVVRLPLDHRPEDDAQRLDRLLRDGELAQELRIHAGARLVARVQVVPERLDDPIRGRSDVRRPLLTEQEQQLIDEPADAR